MPLFADVVVHRGDFTLDASVTVAAGETLALLGPNGSGKSTLLAAIAGLLSPERGHVEVNGRVLTSGGEKAVGPHARRVGLLGQDPLLFPHLSALENIAFGARARRESAVVARAAASAWLDAVGLTGFAERRPSQLSGGQQQRVAIARALAAEPEVLLLDEPMAALDVQNATAVRTLLRERLGTPERPATARPPSTLTASAGSATALPTIVVSHDVVDAMVLADTVAIMDDGRIVDFGDPATVLGQPINQFAANLVGLNLMHGTLGSDGAVHCEGGRMLASAAQDSLREGEPVLAAFPPSAIHISTDADHGPDGPSWRATVGVLEPAVRGIRVPFVGETFAAELTTAELLSSGVREGMSVTITVNPSLISVYRHRGAVPAMAE